VILTQKYLIWLLLPKSVCIRKSRYFSDVSQSFVKTVKTVADKHGHAIGFRTSREH